MKKVYRVGTRKSRLALKQADEITSHLKKFYPEIEFEIIGIDTYGDKDKATPISDIEGTDFFTREIEKALLEGEIDLAVHSAKDLPDKIPDGLCIAAITKSIDPYDALVLRQRSALTLNEAERLVSKNNLTLESLPKGTRIGASSQRRKEQLKKYREDFQVIDIRGNIEQRLEKLERNGLDAAIIAACALMRLGLESRISQRIPFEILKPHRLQGCLSLETRQDNPKLINLLKVLDAK